MSGRRLLLVEDDLALREGLADTLRDEGYDVTVAPDGDRGHELALTRHFDAILLDVMLPGRSGLEVLRAIRDNQLYIFTHPHTWDFIDRRHGRLRAAFDWAAAVAPEIDAASGDSQ